VASRLRNSTIEGGGYSDASPAKASGGEAPGSSGSPPRPSGGPQAASWKLGDGDDSRGRQRRNIECPSGGGGGGVTRGIYLRMKPDMLRKSLG
jgi:hypothetical protein